ncbi:MAG: hypothetical protein AAF151_21245, partial [Cyanobacteria bacterium J06656_5]
MGLERALELIEDAAARNLKKLDLSGLGLSELPDELWQLTQLKVLILGKYDRAKGAYVGNRLPQIPPEVAGLSRILCKRSKINVHQETALWHARK